MPSSGEHDALSRYSKKVLTMSLTAPLLQLYDEV